MSADRIEVAGIPVSTQHHIGGRGDPRRPDDLQIVDGSVD
jgi:hypothetical protein